MAGSSILQVKPETARTLRHVLFVLIVVGALNWLLVGVFDWDLVVALTGGRQPKTAYPHLARIVYIAVGIAAAIVVGSMVFRLFKKGRAGSPPRR
jgi:uncharacterized protein